MRRCDHGGGRRRAGLDRAGAVRGVRADRVPRRHLRAVLPAIRRHHCGRDRDFLLLFADAVAGAGLADPACRMRDKRPPASWNFIARGWDAFTGVFNRGFDRLAHGYGTRRRLRDPAFGGDAGGLCRADRQRRMAARRPRRRASSRRRIAATSSSPCSCRARRRWRAPPRSCARSSASRWIRPASSASRLSPASRARRERRRAMPRRCSRCSTIRKSATRRADCPRTRSPTICASGCPRIQGAFIIVIPPPAVPGIGTGGGFTMRIQDRQGRGPELLAAATDELVGAARKAPGLTQVFSPFTANTPQLFVDIDRVKAQKLGVPIAERHRHDPDLFRLDLCQRLQPVRPHLPRHRAGRPAVPEGDRRIWRGCAPATPPATW